MYWIYPLRHIKSLISTPFTTSLHFRRTFSKMPLNCNKSVIAVGQLNTKSNKEENYQQAEQVIVNASQCGAKIVFLPEAFDFICESKDEMFEKAEPIDGPLISAYKQLAKDNCVWISLGGMHEKTEHKKVSNTHLVIDSNGNIVSKYSKIHLFDVHIPEKNVRLMESSYVLRGSEIPPPVATPAGKLGLSICYDMRFPELSIKLKSMGADILTYPSAFLTATGAIHWEVLLRARAIENQAFVVASAQCGAHNQKRSSWGHAMVIDPLGSVISQCSEGVGFSLAVIDLDLIKKVQRDMPVRNHRRYDLYPRIGPVESNLESIYSQSEYTFGHVKIKPDIIFYKSDFSIAFTNLSCVVPGHVLVIPIRPAKRVVDLTPCEVSDLFLTCQKVQDVVERAYGATSSTIGIQDGRDAGQTVEHVHVHVLPRKPGDFEKNDDIYRELEEHDKREDRKCRTEDEMIGEANLLRPYFYPPSNSECIK